jgi:hypothetical protein
VEMPGLEKASGLEFIHWGAIEKYFLRREAK